MSSHPGFPGSTLTFDAMPQAVRIYEMKLPKGIVNIDQWISPSQFSAGAGKEDFPTLIVDKIFVPLSKKGNILAWVADYSSSPNIAVYVQETLDKIQQKIFPEFARLGLKHFLTVLPPSKFDSMLRKQVKAYPEFLTKVGIKPYLCEDCEEAMKVLKQL